MKKQNEALNKKTGKIKNEENPNGAKEADTKKESKAGEETETKCKKKTEELNKEIDSLKEKLNKEKEDYIRLMAEFDNFRRRSAEERLDLISSASADTIKGLLPVLDDFERAIEMLKESPDEAAKEGTSLIYNKLMSYLKTKGLEIIEAKGSKFDTDFHEAVAQVPVQEELKGLVYDVVSTGYTLHGKILRFAKVVVGI